MNDYRSVLERDLARVGPAPFAFDDVARRRDRKRRNQRIAAGVVGIAVFVAAVWIVTTGGPFDPRGETDNSQGPRARHPSTNARPVEPIPAARPLVPSPPPLGSGLRRLPEVDYVIDLNTGATTPLPEAIIRSSLGEDGRGSGGSHYAVSPDGSQLAYVGDRRRGALRSSSLASTAPGSGR